MTAADRAAFILNLNLDTVGADSRLTALTSGFTGLEPFVRTCSAAIGLPVAIHRAPMPNSDHANFAAHGIPALRLLAGFDRPDSSVRHILTAQDTRDKVAPGELKSAALAAASLLWHALSASPEDVASWRG
jgi:Zn-dependent M28 family amino/carboxypeptidase